MDGYFELERDGDNMIFCKSLLDNAIEPHFHSNIEIVCVLDGEIEATINGIKKTLPKGSISVANSYDVHGYSTPGRSNILVLIIPVDIVNGFNVVMQAKTFRENFLPECDCSNEIKAAMSKMIPYDNTHDSLIAKGYSYEILGLLAERLGLADRKIRFDSMELMRNILLYLEHNFIRDLTLESLAKKYGYNRSYLSRVFNSCLRCGFNHYINIRRARYAAYLIRSTSASLTEISYQSGFNNTRRFNRSFLMCYNLTPMEYRSNFRENKIHTDISPPMDVSMEAFPDFTGNRSIVYEQPASAALHDTGRPETDGWLCQCGFDRANAGMLFGISDSALPPGEYQACFLMKTDDITADNNRIVRMEARDGDTGKALESKEITRKQFESVGSYQPFILDFTQSAGRKTEFSVFWYGTAYTKICTFCILA